MPGWRRWSPIWPGEGNAQGAGLGNRLSPTLRRRPSRCCRLSSGYRSGWLAEWWARPTRPSAMCRSCAETKMPERGKSPSRSTGNSTPSPQLLATMPLQLIRVEEEIAVLVFHSPGRARFTHPVFHYTGSLRSWRSDEEFSMVEEGGDANTRLNAAQVT